MNPSQHFIYLFIYFNTSYNVGYYQTFFRVFCFSRSVWPELTERSTELTDCLSMVLPRGAREVLTPSPNLYGYQPWEISQESLLFFWKCVMCQCQRQLFTFGWSCHNCRVVFCSTPHPAPLNYPSSAFYNNVGKKQPTATPSICEGCLSVV